jgi:predicted GNAT family N-acyltransferase
LRSIVRVESDKDYDAVLSVREDVFIKEQGIPRGIEIDADDEKSIYVLVTEDKEPLGCGRILFKEGYAKLGRIAVKKDRRRQGIGRDICNGLMQIATEHGVKHIVLHAQLSVVKFYEKLGFSKVGNTFKEAGIEHIRMERTLNI